MNRCYIERLNLKNYRCFPELCLNFHDRLTVFVAPNGGGKTAVLDGVAVALRLFVNTLEGRQISKGFDANDIRLVLNLASKMEPVTPVRLEAQGHFLGTHIEWARERHSQGSSSRTTTVEAQDLKEFASQLSKENQQWAQDKNSGADPSLFPLISSYGTGRLWSATKLTEGKKTKESAPNARHRGYTDCLSSSSRYKYFIDWFRRFSYEANKEAKESPHQPQRVLAAVRKAVNLALTPSGWRELEWDFAEDTIVANHAAYGRLPVDLLSDGIRNMIGLVADIAHRAARLNPHLAENAAIETPGIVLIDEVDMHLHPEWQQLILGALTEAFPFIQFIITTHSPQVLTTVKRESIRILAQDEDGIWSADMPDEETKGVESSTAMNDVMGVNQVPPVPEAGWRNDYTALIENGVHETKEGMELRSKLTAHYGEQHPIILDFDRLIRFQAFKRRKSQPSE